MGEARNVTGCVAWQPPQYRVERFAKGLWPRRMFGLEGCGAVCPRLGFAFTACAIGCQTPPTLSRRKETLSPLTAARLFSICTKFPAKRVQDNRARQMSRRAGGCTACCPQVVLGGRFVASLADLSVFFLVLPPNFCYICDLSLKKGNHVWRLDIWQAWKPGTKPK